MSTSLVNLPSLSTSVHNWNVAPARVTFESLSTLMTSIDPGLRGFSKVSLTSRVLASSTAAWMAGSDSVYPVGGVTSWTR